MRLREKLQDALAAALLILIVAACLFIAAGFDSSHDSPSAMEIYYNLCHEKGWPTC